MDLDLLSDDPIDDIDVKNAGEELYVIPSDNVPLIARHLPYQCQTQAEFEQLLTHGVDQVCGCIRSEDWGASLLQWCHYVQDLLSLKYPLTRSYRARVAHLFYELAVMPKLDTYLTDLAATICMRLLKPKKLINIEDLELPWRSLYDVLVGEVYHKQRKIGSSTVSGVLLDLAECAQRFFPASEAAAMLEAMLPHMDGNDLNVCFRGSNLSLSSLRKRSLCISCPLPSLLHGCLLFSGFGRRSSLRYLMTKCLIYLLD